ncbi:hypothetical protein [Bradyrhizobium sp.]|uniref:hypothetical protein n=2 Tax=Bradyrhizobium sp. TaxID=376 RepID=UPI003C72CC96
MIFISSGMEAVSDRSLVASDGEQMKAFNYVSTSFGFAFTKHAHLVMGDLPKYTVQSQPAAFPVLTQAVIRSAAEFRKSLASTFLGSGLSRSVFAAKQPVDRVPPSLAIEGAVAVRNPIVSGLDQAKE